MKESRGEEQKQMEGCEKERERGGEGGVMEECVCERGRGWRQMKK